MAFKLYQVDAFSNEVFGGNPAAVVPLKKWLPDTVLQKIALENNLSETAFFIKLSDHEYDLRWFTPAYEVNLCGHATLASAHVLFKHLNYEHPSILFHTRSGVLTVEQVEGKYKMNFPSDEIRRLERFAPLNSALGATPLEVYRGKDDLLAILENQSAVEALRPNFSEIARIPSIRGVIVSAQGDTVDFVSRCFYPGAGINEDPVTGSAHTTLTPYWANKMNKRHLSAKQLSQRGGQMDCHYLGDRVELIGSAATYLFGVFTY